MSSLHSWSRFSRRRAASTELSLSVSCFLVCSGMPRSVPQIAGVRQWLTAGTILCTELQASYSCWAIRSSCLAPSISLVQSVDFFACPAHSGHFLKSPRAPGRPQTPATQRRPAFKPNQKSAALSTSSGLKNTGVASSLVAWACDASIMVRPIVHTGVARPPLLPRGSKGHGAAGGGAWSICYEGSQGQHKAGSAQSANGTHRAAPHGGRGPRLPGCPPTLRAGRCSCTCSLNFWARLYP